MANKYLVVYDITVGRFYKQFTRVYDTYDDMLRATNELPCDWKIAHIYEIANEINL